MNEKEFSLLRQKGLLRNLTFHESAQGAHISISGRRYINFSSNDYLGLSNHHEIVKAALNALRIYGVGSGSSRLLSGSMIPHLRLEKEIASFKSARAALTFNSGYAANTGIIPAITDSSSLIFSDELNHASIIDGIRLSRAGVRVFKHRDMYHLEYHLKQSMKSRHTRDRLVITDTVFSMDGDIAPLPDIIYLCRKYNAHLMIDEAHATGVIGKNGRGGLEHFGIQDSSVIQMGTLSKAVGCSGGFVAGDRMLIEWLINRSRSFIYSTAFPPVVAAACLAGIRIIATRSKSRRERLWKNTRRLIQGLNRLGYNTLESGTPIVPVMIGKTEEAVKVATELKRKRIFAPAIRPPTVPVDKCRIRFTVTAGHSSKDIDAVLNCMEEMKSKKLKIESEK